MYIYIYVYTKIDVHLDTDKISGSSDPNNPSPNSSCSQGRKLDKSSRAAAARRHVEIPAGGARSAVGEDGVITL